MKLNQSEWKTVDNLFASLREYRERGWGDNLDGTLWWNGKFATVRLGPILLTGTNRCLAIHILAPFFTSVRSVSVCDPEARLIDIDLEEGAAIRVYPEEEGSWWELLRQRMGELGEVLEQLRVVAEREELLSWAEDSVQKVLKFYDTKNPSTRHAENHPGDLITQVTTLSPWQQREKA